MASIQKYVVNAPRPVPPKYRLIDVANIIEETDPHWQTGLQVWGYPETGVETDEPSVWALCSSDGTSIKSEGGTIALPDFDSFTVYLTETCTARSVFDTKRDGETQDEYQARVQQQYLDRALASFAAAESWAVEKEFAGGHLLPGNPHLCDANADVLNSGAVTDAKEALARLVNAVGETGQQGLIHATPATIVGWGEFYVRPEGGLLITMDGVPIVRGTGYIDQHPVGESQAGSGEDWAFATGPVDVRRTQVFVTPGDVSQALDRDNNTLTYRVERTYTVDWSTTLQAAVLVDWTS